MIHCKAVAQSVRQLTLKLKAGGSSPTEAIFTFWLILFSFNSEAVDYFLQVFGFCDHTVMVLPAAPFKTLKQDLNSFHFISVRDVYHSNQRSINIVFWKSISQHTDLTSEVLEYFRIYPHITIVHITLFCNWVAQWIWTWCEHFPVFKHLFYCKVVMHGLTILHHQNFHTMLV